MPAGRPTDYTPELAEYICDEMAKPRSMVDICNEPDMPDQTTVYRWLVKHDEFRQMYTRAREIQADASIDKGMSEVDAAKDKDEIIGATKKAETRIKFAEKLNPRKYGNKLELSGSLEVQMTDDQLESRVTQLLGKAGIGASAGGEGETEETA